KGHFVFAGLPYVGKYVIAVSAANMSPNIFPNAQAGREQDYEIVLSPGDGRRLTEAEPRAAVSNSAPAAGTSETAEQSGAGEERERRSREIEQNNSRNRQANEILNRTFTAGNV